MASWVFCNYCFQSPRRTSSFSLTSCGHVYCDACLGKGKKDECLICKVPCRTVLLSKHTDSDIQAFFMGIDGLCRKYSQETAQVSEFQEKHRKRLLAFYRAKISQLEESLRKSALQVEQLQSMRSSQHTAFSTTKNSISTKPRGCQLLPPHSSAPDRVESMEVDLSPSPMRKPEVAAGPTRISLISPPQGGRMGSVSYPGPPHPSLTPRQVGMAAALRVPPVQMPCKGASPAPASWPPGRAAPGGSPVGGVAQARPPRPPISISGLLQRQCLGSAPFGGLTQGR
ncbi:probable E3 SUMO-protein ligase RNF212 isoform X2 [Marmota marmota marmota]|uniref:probable E3 SUMO-protein ligase RNF212 isoform X2 n=2 Tax=Marmota marmota marmota TaxID=9994 RepID=UPI002092DA21|nr:probable E3 SUMO-protein ligase RNF212 isoform X2 [Marmota marmota marmota]